MTAAALVTAKVTPAPGFTPAFGSSAWLVLVICVVAFIVIFVAVLAAGIWQRRRRPRTNYSARDPR